jgi:hypothetical protein
VEEASCEMLSIEQLYKDIEKNIDHTFEPCSDISEIDTFVNNSNFDFPNDLKLFYRRYSWVKLFIGAYGSIAYRFVPIEEIHPTRIDIYGKDLDEYGPKEWITICDVMEGNYICVDLSSKAGEE